MRLLNLITLFFVAFCSYVLTDQKGMATVGGTALTLNDWARSLDPEGRVAKIVEIMNLTN